MFVPSVVVAVMVVVPIDRDVTLPVWLTVATVGLLEVQFSLVMKASEGSIVATSCSKPPI